MPFYLLECASGQEDCALPFLVFALKNGLINPSGVIQRNDQTEHHHSRL